MLNGKDELDFQDIESGYTGIKEELRELITLTESKESVFNFRIEDRTLPPMKFDLSSFARYAKEAIIYYSCLREMVTERDIRIYEFPAYNHDNFMKVLILYSYYFEKGFDASILYDSNLTYSIGLPPVPDFTEQFHNKHNAFKVIGEINDFSFGNIRFEKIHNGLIIKNSIKQEVIEDSSESYKLKVTSKPSDYILGYADSDDKIDSILSDAYNILDIRYFDKFIGVLD